MVFAGGGARCFWQAGFWEAVSPSLPRPPEVVTAVSAGASTACHALSGCSQQAMEYYLEGHAARAQSGYHRHPLSLKPDRERVAFYRDAFLDVLGDESLERLRSGPEIRVLMATAPVWAPGSLGILVGFLAYSLEKAIKAPLHPIWAQALGFKPVVGFADRCATVEQVADLVLASSCVPPIMEPVRWQGQAVLDGGLIDNAPVALLAEHERPALVMLTRRYPPEKLRGHPGLTYVQPSEPLPISKWESANPDALHRAVELGMADGERFLRSGPAA
ncbi:MAG: patatin-like phospholipase family protein [Desulfarculaceae bacterium]|nr:patatin-like phospholipase family protein [Desulfarculaceae bacterium]MCF8071692.1 patatin-like phospholipase family protein [Desulfarculaceae bacterium]MCF8102461.1 patatin-like phospholipase family protein [Desulfarculaceae bacterium]MCF8116803.1 patatin-like phospholipase family protein [Desulfarculaceae bacterium]